MFKTNLKFIIFFLLFYSSGFYAYPFLNQKNILKTIITNVIIKDKVVNEIHEEIPFFIEEDLKEFNIETKELLKSSWERFLKLYTEQYNIQKNNMFIENISMQDLIPFYGKIDLEKIKSLVDIGYDINKIDKNTGASLISYYFQEASTFDINILDALINMGVDLNNKEDDIKKLVNSDLIYSALLNSKPEVGYKLIQFLKSKDIPIYNQNFKLNIRMIMNQNKYKKEYLNKILPNINPNTRMDNSTYNVLEFILTENAEDENINILLDKDIKLNQSYKDINTLHYASKNENISMHTYQRLIDLGANINSQTKETLETPLMLSIRNKNIKQIEILLNNGANIYIKNNKGQDIFDYIKKIKNNNRRKKIESLIGGY